MISIDKTNPTPLYQQLYDSAKQSIMDGGFQAGEQLPSIRYLMNELGVSRNTVTSAYRQLCAEGYVSARRCSGYTVNDLTIDILQDSASFNELPSNQQTTVLPENPRRSWKYDFYYGNLLQGSFPADDWRRIINGILYAPVAAEMTSYGNNHGERGLREEIARYLYRSRGVHCVPEQIVLTSGTQQSIAQILSLFDPAQHVFGMENPGYDGARLVVEHAGFTVCPLRTSCGADAFLEDVASSSAKLIYTTPSHQMPIGTMMNIQTRTKLLELAAESNIFILEDDYDSEFRFGTRPIPSLQSIDCWERVIYMGTFSKILSPALRLSYIVLPPKLLGAYKKKFSHCFCTVPWLEQETLRQFMAEGLWDRHVRSIVRSVRARHMHLISCIKHEMGEHVEIIGGCAGLHLLLKVSNGMTQEELAEAAARRDVNICSTRQYWMDPSKSPDDTVLLGYSSASISVIEEGIAQLVKAWF